MKDKNKKMSMARKKKMKKKKNNLKKNLYYLFSIRKNLCKDG
jgi:hypothetical protein